MFNRKPDLSAETLYVIGGLYGNLPALDAVHELAANEPGGATLVFNGDFNWFNIDAAGFSAINEQVLKHTALRGNVETELAGGGCGVNLGLVYAVSPRLSRYSRGLSEPREILIRFSLYQQM